MEKDCPECEYCCLIGLCCPPEAQHAALVARFQKQLSVSQADAEVYAKVIVDARVRANKS